MSFNISFVPGALRINEHTLPHGTYCFSFAPDGDGFVVRIWRTGFVQPLDYPVAGRCIEIPSGQIYPEAYQDLVTLRTAWESALVEQFGAVTIAGGSINVDNFPSGFNVLNFPGVQPVSGSVDVGNFPSGFNVLNLPGVQPVSGSVNVGNLPATQGVVMSLPSNLSALRVDAMTNAGSLLRSGPCLLLGWQIVKPGAGAAYIKLWDSLSPVIGVDECAYYVYAPNNSVVFEGPNCPIKSFSTGVYAAAIKELDKTNTAQPSGGDPQVILFISY